MFKEEEYLKILIHFNKEKFRLKLPNKTKVLSLEEFLKRKNSIRPTESIFLFDKHRKVMLLANEYLIDIVRRQK